MSSHYRLETEAGVLIADHVDVADGLLSRALGLMFRRDLPAGHGLTLRPCRSVHMFFMRFPLDVVFVDGDGRVVRIIAPLRPWRASSVVRRAKAAIELPAGTVERAGLIPGTLVRLIEA